MASQAKFGRGLRSPCMKAYKNTNKCSKNKAARVTKEAARQAVPKNMKVPRGTARALRRAGLQRKEGV